MKNLLISGLLFLAFLPNLSAQIVCIQCSHQNEAISPGAANLILNGGFEAHTCDPGWLEGSYCPSSNFYSCDIDSWRCIGGGTSSYPNIFDTLHSLIPEGLFAAYFGNGNGFVCADLSFDTSCLVRDGCTVTGIPPGFPTTLDGYGGPEGVSLEQTVDDFVVGDTYILEFWAGGEPLEGFLLSPGIFAVDIGFGKTYLSCLPTQHGTDSKGTMYLIRFMATSPTHTITFTNWGHMCSDCTELVIDNVRLYTLAELNPAFEKCLTSSEDADVDEVIVYPNPTESIVYLNLPEQQDYKCEVLDVNGKKVINSSFERRVDVSTLVSGIYFIVIKGEKGSIVKRLIKM